MEVTWTIVWHGRGDGIVVGGFTTKKKKAQLSRNKGGENAEFGGIEDKETGERPFSRGFMWIGQA